MTSLPLSPKTTKRRVCEILIVVFLGFPLAVYGALLAGNALSAWRISRVLNRLEKIRVGDPAPTLLSTIEGCDVKQSDSEYLCQVYHFPLQFEWLDAAFRKLPRAETWAERFRHLGLREQWLNVSATIDRQRVKSISVTLLVAGRYESLGNHWEIAEQIPERDLDDSSPYEDHRTVMNWFHITNIRRGISLLCHTHEYARRIAGTTRESPLSVVISGLRRVMRASTRCHSRSETTQPRIWWLHEPTCLSLRTARRL